MNRPFRFPDPPFFAFFAVSVPIAFRIGFLHTEIAKITQTDLDWMTVFDSLTLFSLRYLRSLCEFVFSDRIFTHRDRKDH